MLPFHFFLLLQNPDFTMMLAEAFNAIYSPQEVTFSSCERKFTLTAPKSSFRKLLGMTGAQRGRQKLSVRFTSIRIATIQTKTKTKTKQKITIVGEDVEKLVVEM